MVTDVDDLVPQKQCRVRLRKLRWADLADQPFIAPSHGKRSAAPVSIGISQRHTLHPSCANCRMATIPDGRLRTRTAP